MNKQNNHLQFKHGIYISGAVTGYEHIVDNVFEHGERIARAFTSGRIYNPTREIERTSSWDDAMTICRRELRSNAYDAMFVLDSNASRASRGVREEIEIARELGVPVYFINAQSLYDATF